MTRPLRSDLIARSRTALANSGATQALGSAFAKKPELAAGVARRWGVIKSINAGNTLTVTLSGVDIPGIKRLSSYIPTVGDNVQIDVVGTDLHVVGTLASPTPNDLTTRLAAEDTRLSALEAAMDAPRETQSVLAPGYGWVNYGGGYQQLGYELIGTRVFLRGLVSNALAITNGGPSVMFSMPTGLVPAVAEIFNVMAGQNVASRVDVRSDGTVALTGNLAANNYVSVSGITYSTL